MRPRLLDLFCCEGGAARGYVAAGFDVFGVDLFEQHTQARYPYPSHKGDAIKYVQTIMMLRGVRHAERLTHFDAVHASPPCQRHTAGTRAIDRSGYPDLIGPTRALLVEIGLPYVIENVPGSPLIDPLTLCGTMFDLTATDDDGTALHLRRHRLFESSIPLYAPRPCHHPPGVQWAGAYGGARRDKHEARNVRHGGYVPSGTVQARLLDVEGMTQKGMGQCIPPAYCEWLGAQLLDHLARAA